MIFKKNTKVTGLIDLEDVVKYGLHSKAKSVFQDEVDFLLFSICPAVTVPGVS